MFHMSGAPSAVSESTDSAQLHKGSWLDNTWTEQEAMCRNWQQESNPDGCKAWLAREQSARTCSLAMLTGNWEFCKMCSEGFPTSAQHMEVLRAVWYSSPYIRKLNKVSGLARDPEALSKMENDTGRHLMSTLSLQMQVYTHACALENTHVCPTYEHSYIPHTHTHARKCSCYSNINYHSNDLTMSFRI